MDTIRRLTGGVAHDFNNLLMAVLGIAGTRVHLWLPRAKTSAAIGERAAQTRPLAPATARWRRTRDCSWRIQERFPGLPIILAAGYAEPPADPAALGIARLAKPCTQDEIVTALQCALRPPAGAAEGRLKSGAARA